MNHWWQAAARPVDRQAEEQARERQQQLTKPRGSLGQLEQLAITLAGLQGRVRPSVERVWICLFAGDHGVTEEGVSPYPQAVTGQMLRNFVNGGAAIAVLARQLNAQLELIDLGCAVPLDPPLQGVRQLYLGPGTANFSKAPAMSAGQLNAALQAGRDSVAGAVAAGHHLYLCGEMGIGNTSAASALACALLGSPVVSMVGTGTGLDEAGVANKIAVIERALAFHAGHLDDPLFVLQRLGGFEIAALTGAYLACAQQGLPALVDGFICSVAALLAVRLNPSCRDWLLFSHCGAEPGHRHVLMALAAEPLLQLGLRLGEGSGAALAVPLLQMACRLHGEMATFAEAAVADAGR